MSTADEIETALNASPLFGADAQHVPEAWELRTQMLDIAQRARASYAATLWDSPTAQRDVEDLPAYVHHEVDTLKCSICASGIGYLLAGDADESMDFRLFVELTEPTTDKPTLVCESCTELVAQWGALLARLDWTKPGVTIRSGGAA